MKEKVDIVFSLLDSNNISYYLLRPLDFRETIYDVDLIVLKEDYNTLKKVLSKEFGQLYYKPSNANESTQLLVDGLLLDIKFAICFLPRKSLVLSYDIPFSTVLYKTEYLLIPDIEEEKLFTFWTHHLLLDKKQPSDSSTFLVFKSLYTNKWKHLIETDYFEESLKKIYLLNSRCQAKQLILDFFNQGLKPNEKEINSALKKIVLRNRIGLQFKYIYDKLKFGIYRRLGKYENYRAIK